MSQQIQAPTCSHGYTTYNRLHPDGRICSDEAWLTDQADLIVATAEVLRNGVAPLMPGRLYYVLDHSRFLLYTGDQDDTPQDEPYWIGWRTSDVPAPLRDGVLFPSARRYPARVGADADRPAHAAFLVGTEAATRHGAHLRAVPTPRGQSGYRGLPEALPTGRTYGTNARGPLSRLASKVKRLPARTKVWAGLALAVFAVLFIVLCARALWLNVDPPAYVPQPTPSLSPHLRTTVPDPGVRPQ